MLLLVHTHVCKSCYVIILVFSSASPVCAHCASSHPEFAHPSRLALGCHLSLSLRGPCLPRVVKIVTGSLQGRLRVYLPRDREQRPEDLLLEQELEGGAVLSLACGRFVP